jgi:hypothetical protein
MASLGTGSLDIREYTIIAVHAGKRERRADEKLTLAASTGRGRRSTSACPAYEEWEPEVLPPSRHPEPLGSQARRLAQGESRRSHPSGQTLSKCLRLVEGQQTRWRDTAFQIFLGFSREHQNSILKSCVRLGELLPRRVASRRRSSSATAWLTASSRS